MDFTPPTSPVLKLDPSMRIATDKRRLPISPAVSDTTKFSSTYNGTFLFNKDDLDVGVNASSYGYLMEDLSLYKLSPTDPKFGSSIEMIEYLNELTNDNITERMISRSMDFIKNPDLKFKSNTVIGHGSYCYIYEVETHGSAPLVVKFPHSKRKSRTILNESIVLTYLHMHGSKGQDYSENFIIPFYGITYLNKSHFKRLRWNEYMPGILMPKFSLNLQQFIQLMKTKHSKNINLKRTLWWKLFHQMLIALSHLKTKNVIHGDIKTANILVKTKYDSDGSLSDDVGFCLCDFTSSIIELPNGGRNITDRTSSCPMSPSLNLDSTLDTTLEYCPPEIIQNITDKDKNHRLFNYDTDLYSFALCLLSFITEDEPYNELKNFKFHDMSDSYSGANISNISSSVQHTQWLINAILKDDPIGLNTFESSRQEYYSNYWSNELSILSKILKDRISLEESISYI